MYILLGKGLEKKTGEDVCRIGTGNGNDRNERSACRRRKLYYVLEIVREIPYAIVGPNRTNTPFLFVG